MTACEEIQKLLSMHRVQNYTDSYPTELYVRTALFEDAWWEHTIEKIENQEPFSLIMPDNYLLYSVRIRRETDVRREVAREIYRRVFA